MATKNLIHSLRQDLTPELCEAVSHRFGEDSGSVYKVFDSVLPLLVGNLARHVTEVVQIDRLYQTIINSDAEDADVEMLTRKLQSQTADDWLAMARQRAQRLLGARAATIADAETALAHLRPDSAEQLVGIAMMMVLGELKRELERHHLDSDGLTYLLMSQKAVLRGKIDPALATALGYQDPDALIAGIASVPEGDELVPSWFRSFIDTMRHRSERKDGVPPMPPSTGKKGPLDIDTLSDLDGEDRDRPRHRPGTLH